MKYTTISVIAILITVAACAPSKDDITATCVEISETRNMDGAVRIRLLRELGIPADDLERVHRYIQTRFAIGRGVKRCAEYLARELGVQI